MPRGSRRSSSALTSGASSSAKRDIRSAPRDQRISPSKEDAALLTETYEFLERTRNRLYLVESSPSDSLPNQPERLTWLARSLGDDAAGLRERYRRLTRRTRKVVERVFYGRE